MYIIDANLTRLFTIFSYHLSKLPIISRRRESLDGPLLQQVPGYHVHLDTFEGVPVHLMTGLDAATLHASQSLVIMLDGIVVLYT